MDSWSRPVTMSMPPKSSFLSRENDFICEVCSWFYWTLCDILRTIRPWVSWLFYSMPANSFNLSLLNLLEQRRRETWTRGAMAPPIFFFFKLIYTYSLILVILFYKSHFAPFNIIIDSFRSITLATKFSITFLQAIVVVNFYWFASDLSLI